MWHHHALLLLWLVLWLVSGELLLQRQSAKLSSWLLRV